MWARRVSLLHYDDCYFEGQKKNGDTEGKSELFKFQQFVNRNDTVLDFGCGGGFTLKNIECRRRLGVDINPSARKYAQSQGIEVFENIGQLPEDIIDVVISNHALEHVFSPLDVLCNLRGKLKSTSRVVFVVPHDCANQAWRPNDTNMHLYTWNMLTIGNLFVTAGYTVERIDLIRHRWPWYPGLVMKSLGHAWFHRIGYLVGWLTGTSQVRIVAKPRKEPAVAKTN
jgi:SAM-dependent methyltransferase